MITAYQAIVSRYYRIQAIFCDTSFLVLGLIGFLHVFHIDPIRCLANPFYARIDQAATAKLTLLNDALSAPTKPGVSEMIANARADR